MDYYGSDQFYDAILMHMPRDKAENTKITDIAKEFIRRNETFFFFKEQN